MQPLPTVLVLSARERTRTALRTALPRRKWRIAVVKTPREFTETFSKTLVDAAVIDFGGGDDFWAAANVARDYPSTAFFGAFPMRATDGPSIARCIAGEFADIIADGIDDQILRDLIAPQTFSFRFATALQVPPAGLALRTPMQLAAWRAMLPYAGRPIRTSDLAQTVGVTREHLSRHFAHGGAPNLKRIIDLVRLIGAAELSKNPGYDIRDIAVVLGFASSSHLAVTANRVLGTKPASLARLRTVDLFDRFLQGRTRSRG